ncbi:MAG: DUF3267 domain-containing protein [Bacteroidales bacterium]
MEKIKYTGTPVEFVVADQVLLRFALVFTIIYPIILTTFFLFWYPAVYLREGLTFLWHIILWLVPVIIVHEGLHAFFWALLSGQWRHVRFGFNRQYLTFYTHCSVPLSKATYFAGGIAPFLMLSLMPAVYALVTGSYYWLAFAIFNGWTCAADLLMCYHILRLPRRVRLLDHPEKLGFFIFS